MDHRISRAQLFTVAGGATAGALILPGRARAANQIVNYPDGVGLVDPYGNIIERAQYNQYSVTASGGGYVWSIPLKPPPGFKYSPVSGVTISLSNVGRATYVTPRTQGSTQTQPQPSAPIDYGDSLLGTRTIAYMPKEFLGGGKGGPQPHSAECVVAIANLVAAACCLVGALGSFLDGPVLWGPDMWALVSAAGYFSSAELAMQLACQG